MTYEIALLEADIRNAMDGNMLLALRHAGEQRATLEYHWTAEKFTAVFHGHAPSLPAPAHPTYLLHKPIAALRALKTDAHQRIVDVFLDHPVTFEISE